MALMLDANVTSNLVPSVNWDTLNSSVSGRLFQYAPFARACFEDAEGVVGTYDVNACAFAQAHYSDGPEYRDTIPSSYQGLQWETCPSKGESCLLDWMNPLNEAAFDAPKTCHQGSIPTYFLDVQTATDVQNAFKFSVETGVNLVVKNTGHEFQGRSARPGSLALWTKNLQKIEYEPAWIPTGCEDTAPRIVVRLGPGITFSDLYAFGEANNITLPGGSTPSVSATGGYVLGGGHGSLSNTAGLGTDRALEFTIVVPTGDVLTANACQNTDLYFALRGGGGGTFGVVMETVTLALPRTPIHVITLDGLSSDADTTKAFWKVLVDNSLEWANAGWGGVAGATSLQYINPLPITEEEARTSMQPLTEFAAQLNLTVGQEQYDSFALFYQQVLEPLYAISGFPLSTVSRLLPAKNFETSTSREELLEALLNASANHSLTYVFATTPYAYKADNLTSLTPAWRDSLLLIEVLDTLEYNATASEQKTVIEGLSKSMDYLRNITPDSGTYFSESDLYEPEFENSFWGANYERLAEIKLKYDPLHILDCWHCVGWKGRSDEAYSCYP
ncbi:FAD-binding domain-containing protein [Lentinula aff. detonsa]|uniref:FAD-binding domain-containing protein n=1 Tax=Lentinula aff. detonsa TaxID=2804958 RepID=A0AA38KRK4_9AGAR|nr:FAD-binding domain-containing protein [Lentinula aff. detonsa]